MNDQYKYNLVAPNALRVEADLFCVCKSALQGVRFVLETPCRRGSMWCEMPSIESTSCRVAVGVKILVRNPVGKT